MAHLVEIYRDPLFLWFPILTCLISVGGFLAMALPMSWLAIRNPAWLRPYRLQDRPLEAGRVFGPSLAWQARNLACLLALAVVTWPLVRSCRCSS